MRAKNEFRFLAEAYNIKILAEKAVDGTLMCSKDCCGSPVMECKCGDDCPHCNCFMIQKAVKDYGLKSPLLEAAEKQKGVDGKACWKGYRREGTKKKGGKTVDNCVKVEDEETQQKFKIYFTTALNPDGEDAEGWISYGTDEEDAWDNLYNYFKSIPPGPGYRGRNLMSFYRVQIEPYKEGDPCSTAMGPCEDITVKSEDNEVEFPNSEYGRSLERDAKQHEQEDKEMRDDIERLQKLVADGYVRLHKVIENEETGKKEDHYQVLAPWMGSTSFPILKAQGWEEVPFPSIRLTLNEPGTASVQLRPPYTDIHKYLDKGYKVVDNYVKATQSEDDEENEDEDLDVTQGDTSADDLRALRHTPF